MSSSRLVVPILVFTCFTSPSTSLAGDNPYAKFAMHVVASDEYLDCEDLIPARCESINVDVSVEEILAAGGYGYVAFVAYDVDGLTGAEFAVSDWPTGRGAPPLMGPYWCPEGTLTLGNPLDGGGIISFPCREAENGIVLLGYLSFGPADEGDFPIDLEYEASAFSYPKDAHNYVLDCTFEFREDPVVATSGCRIGGSYSGTEPDCERDGGGEETRETPAVRFLGPGIQRARDSGAWVNLAGEHVDEKTEVYLRSESRDEQRSTRTVFLGDEIFAYKAATTEADTGFWSIVVSNGPRKTIVFENMLRLVPSMIRYRAERCGNEYLRGAVSVKLRNGVLALPGRADVASPAEASVESDRLAEIFDTFSVTRIERIFKGRTPADTVGEDINGNRIRLDDLSQFYLFWLPEYVDPVDVGTDLEILPEVKQVWLSYPVVQFAETYEPDDYFYTEFPDSADSSQWNLRKIGCPEAWAKDTCSVEVRISIIDDGVRYTHEDLGGSTGWLDFPNEKVVGGWDFADSDDYPYPAIGDAHGTPCAGIAAPQTNNLDGVAAVGWNAKILAYRCTNCMMPGTPKCAADATNAILRSVEDSAMVVSMSWGFYGCGADSLWSGIPQQCFADMKAAVHESYTSGVTLVAAGGNHTGWRPGCPATFQGVVGVGKTGENDDYARGTYGAHIDIAAPTGVITTSSTGDHSYTSFGGTSAAAPHVSGVAALLQSRAYSLFGEFSSGEDICGFMCASAESVQIDTTVCDPDTLTYPNIYVGWGRINAAKAMERLEEPYNGGQGPVLLSTAGADAYRPDTSLEYLSSDSVLFHQYRCLKWASFGAAYGDYFAWGMDRYTTNGAPPFPGDEDEMHWSFCKVVPHTITAWGCSLQCYVFRKIDETKADTSWIPCRPESLKWSYRVSGILDSVAVQESPAEPRFNTELMQNYPNPFNPNTTISFTLSSRERVSLKIYDVTGRLVRTLVDESMPAGTHRIIWDGRDSGGLEAATGVYFCRLQARGLAKTKKLVLLR